MDGHVPWAWKDAVEQALGQEARHDSGDPLADIARSLEDLNRQLSELVTARRFHLYGEHVRHDAQFIEAQHPRDEGGKFTEGAGKAGAKKSQSFGKKAGKAPAELNGVKFESWKPPTTVAGWQGLADSGPKISAPPIPPLPKGKIQGSGVIIQEPDGSVWVMHPSRQFGGYNATFPKGQQDLGLSLRANALKEAYEETGLKVELTAYAGDVERGTSNARYYFAKRVGGTPDDHGEESSKVTLAPVEELEDHLNTHVDRKMVKQFLQKGEEKKPSAPGKLSTEGMKQTGGQKGSNPGGVFQEPGGKSYYVKFSKSKTHAQNELTAERLYAAAGAPTLNAQPVDWGGGKLGTATEWKEGIKNIDRHSADQRKLAQANFAVHAWLANWDAAGLAYDNQGMVGDKMTTLDTGGSLLFRAQGGLKGGAFGTEAGEWESMRHPVPGLAPNKEAHAIYGDMTPEQLKESAKKVQAVPDKTIREIVEANGPGTAEQRADLAEKLIKRKQDIVSRAGLGSTKSDAVRHDAWDESAHPRAPAGSSEGGQFTSGGGGGGAFPTASSPTIAAAAATKKVAAAVKALLDKKESHGVDQYEVTQAADMLKAYGASHYSHSYTKYAHELLAHMEDVLGLEKGSLGKTSKKKKPKGEAGAPSEAEIEKMASEAQAEEIAAPTPEPEGMEVPKPPSEDQHSIYQYAINKDMSLEWKLDGLAAYAKAQEKAGNTANAKYAEQAKAALEKQKAAPAPKLEVEPETTPSPDIPSLPEALKADKQAIGIHELATDDSMSVEDKIEAIETIKSGDKAVNDYKAEMLAVLSVQAEHEDAAPEAKKGAIPEPEGILKSSHVVQSVQLIANDGTASLATKIASIRQFLAQKITDGSLKMGSPAEIHAQEVIAALEEQAEAAKKKQQPHSEAEIGNVVVSNRMTAKEKLDWLEKAEAEGMIEPSAQQYAADWKTMLQGIVGAEEKKGGEAKPEWMEELFPTPELTKPSSGAYSINKLYDMASKEGDAKQKIADLLATADNMSDPANKEYAATLALELAGVGKPANATQTEMWEAGIIGGWKLETKVKDLTANIASAGHEDALYGQQILDTIAPKHKQMAEAAAGAEVPVPPDLNSGIQAAVYSIAKNANLTLDQKIDKVMAGLSASHTPATTKYAQDTLDHLKAQKAAAGQTEQKAAPTFSKPPSAGSAVQKKWHEMATSPAHSMAEKVAFLEDKIASGYSKETTDYGKQLLKELKGGAAAAPKTTPPPDNSGSALYYLHKLTTGEMNPPQGKTVLQYLTATAENSSTPEIVNYATQLISELGGPPPKPQAPKIPDGPKPHASSKGQQQIWDITQSAKTPQEKIAAINAVMADPKVSGTYTKQYGEEWNKLLGGGAAAAKPSPSAPASKPAYTPPPKPAATVHSTTNQKRLERGKAMHAAAKKIDSAKDPEAKKICKSLSRAWWNKVDPAARSAVISYKGGSGSINGALRQLETEKAGAHTQEQINHIDELFEHEDAVLTQDVILRRGETVPAATIQWWIDALAAGKPVRPQKKGFVSTSMAYSAAMGGNVQYEIIARKGTRAIGAWAADTSFNSENEVLLRHGSVFEVYEIEEKGGKYIVRCMTM